MRINRNFAAAGYLCSRLGEMGYALEKAIASGEPAVIQRKIDPKTLNTLRNKD